MLSHVYILRLQNDQLYVGATSDLERRLSDHRAGCGCKTTSRPSVCELLYCETFPDFQAALGRERQLKGWSRAKKLALIRGDLKQLKKLARAHKKVKLVGIPP